MSYPALAAFEPIAIWQWASSYLLHRLGFKHPFQDYTERDGDVGIYPLSGDCDEIRVVIAGDWGTGTDEAAQVAERMLEFAPHFSIHLGDVYYVGDTDEVRENFLGINNPETLYDPVRFPTGSLGTFAINGNHEMYARGKGYFDDILPAIGPIVDGEPAGQGASFFCLENEFWRIVAVDTGYNSVGTPLWEYFSKPKCELPDQLLDWLRLTVKLDPADPRGIVFLSHHQYFSRYEDWYPAAARQLAHFVKRPVLWFWGHEHRIAVYKLNSFEGGPSVHGRCIGHGGMPVDLPPTNPLHAECEVLFEDTRVYESDENMTLGYNGFARLTFRRETLHVDYVDLRATVVYAEDWRVELGQLVWIGCN